MPRTIRTPRVLAGDETLTESRDHVEALGTPTVVFLDETKWHCFFQLAATLRRKGVRCVRVTTMPSTRSRIASRLVFDRCVQLPAERHEEVLRSVLLSENVVDIQFSENFVDLIGRCATALTPSLYLQLRRRVELMDKVRAGQFMERLGASTPARVELTSPDLMSFVQAHGVPVLMKNRIGYGGRGVSVIEDQDDVVDRMAALGDAKDHHYLEQYIAGRRINYGAVVVDGELAQDVCYETLRTVDLLGPLMQLVTCENAEVHSVGRRIVVASGCNGPMNIQFVQDEDGTCWPFDFNLRAFGPVTSFVRAGLDFGEGYLRSLGLSAQLTSTHATSGVTIDGYPETQRALVRSGHRLKGLASFIAGASENAQRLGWRYIFLEALALLTLRCDEGPE